MISVKNVSKFFGTFPALKDISFEIAKGEIIGFLGPNGAGKTTLMRLLTAYLFPSKGQVAIAGFDTQKNPLLVKRRIGYLPETPPLYPEMTVIDYLKFAARLKDVNPKALKAQIEKTLEDCDLKNAQRQNIQTLSKGFKQRVGIAQAVIHNPDVLILDEPTSGLDPLQILQVRRLIKAQEYERTVILSTHILSEIEQMAKRVIIIKEGKIVADSLLTELLQSNAAPRSKVNLEEVFLKLTA